jgi:hypothetical protein
MKESQIDRRSALPSGVAQLLMGGCFANSLEHGEIDHEEDVIKLLNCNETFPAFITLYMRANPSLLSYKGSVANARSRIQFRDEFYRWVE